MKLNKLQEELICKMYELLSLKNKAKIMDNYNFDCAGDIIDFLECEYE